MKKSPRYIAIAILEEILEAGAYANIALRRSLAENALPPRDNAFITELVNETLRNLIQIDHTINQYSKTPLDKQKPFIRNLLRISVCQLNHLEKIPHHAAINEAVNLAKSRKLMGLAGFINGLLRNISRGGVPDHKDIALKYSYPKWLVKKLDTWGIDPTAFCQNSHTPPPVTIYPNTPQVVEALAKDNIETTDLGKFLILNKPGDITQLTAFKQGLFFVMDPGAIQAVEAANPQPGETILDLCAAPGGKTFAMAMAGASVQAFDIHPHRVQLISQTAKRLKLKNVTAKVQDATIQNLNLIKTADTILLDVPCTGFGTIRKNPEIKYTRTQEDIIDLQKVQRDILQTAAQYVKPGGKIVYCTCTITTEENMDNVNHFLNSHPNFTLAHHEQTLPSPTNDAFFVAVIKSLDI